MSETTRATLLLQPPAPNGDGHKPRATRKPKPTPRTTSPTARRPATPRRFWTPRRTIAAGVGGVGVVLLALSVYHCAEALMVLTGSPIMLAAMLAIGIDLGLVASELAAIIGSNDRRARCWANAYVIAAIVLSAGLNELANGLHADEGYVWLARGVGLGIPALVFILSKLTGLLWE